MDEHRSSVPAHDATTLPAKDVTPAPATTGDSTLTSPTAHATTGAQDPTASTTPDDTTTAEHTTASAAAGSGAGTMTTAAATTPNTSTTKSADHHEDHQHKHDDEHKDKERHGSHAAHGEHPMMSVRRYDAPADITSSTPAGAGRTSVDTHGNLIHSDDPSTAPHATLTQKLVGDVKGGFNGVVGSLQAMAGTITGNKTLQTKGFDKMSAEDHRLGAKHGVPPVGSSHRETVVSAKDLEGEKAAGTAPPTTTAATTTTATGQGSTAATE